MHCLQDMIKVADISRRDFQKLIFYYYADHYINFKDLITDLYRIYKTRIWLSAVNPASFSQHAMGQPPSGIGPGAITYNGGIDQSYAMAYGPDPDPYGAVRPYSIGYDTYTPNYPGIPGVANSFAGGNGQLSPFGAAQAAGNFQPATDASAVAPSVQPGASQTGSMSDYSYYYDRNGGSSEYGMPFSPADTPAPSSASTNPAAAMPFNPYAGQRYGHGPTGQAPYAGPMTPISPWNNTNSPMNPASAGLGRQADVPLPIGTRPFSNGSAQTPFTALRSGRSFINGANDGSNQSPSRGAYLNSYMQQLNMQDPSASHTDELSRER